MEHAELIRKEFDKALNAALLRALAFNDFIYEHIDVVFGFVLKANVSTWSSEADISAFYLEMTRSYEDHAFDMIDFLSDINILFTGGVALHAIDFDVNTVLAKAFSANVYGDMSEQISSGSDLAAFKQRIYANTASEETYLSWVRKYPWLRAMLCIRLFALERVMLTGFDFHDLAKLRLGVTGRSM